MLDQLSESIKFNFIGTAFEIEENYLKAKEYYDKCLKYQKLNSGDLNLVQHAQTYQNIGQIYKKMGFVQKALENYEMCLRIKKECSADLLQIADSLDDLGTIQFDMGDQDAALKYHEECLKIRI